MIRLEHVDKQYPPKQTALRDVSIEIKQGEFAFITGASGAGKSTLFKLLFGEERASRGEVSVDGVDLVRCSLGERAQLRRRLGVIFQDYKLLPSLSILENVAFPLEAMEIAKKARLQLAYKMLEAVGLADRVHALPDFLSGGEQQRVAIARALIARPKVILADEPTGNLDPKMTEVIFNLLIEANKSGATVVVASHNVSLIEAFNRRTLVLEKGRVRVDLASPAKRPS